MSMTRKEVAKEIRKASARIGLTFKVDNTRKINGETAYKFTIRKNNETVMDNCTLGSAYDKVCSGYLNSWNGVYFVGIAS